MPSLRRSATALSSLRAHRQADLTSLLGHGATPSMLYCLRDRGIVMSQTENILNSLKYLKQEAQVCGNSPLCNVIEAAICMAEMTTKLSYMYENEGQEQDILRVMTFINFYRTAPTHVQQQVLSVISAREDSSKV